MDNQTVTGPNVEENSIPCTKCGPTSDRTFKAAFKAFRSLKGNIGSASKKLDPNVIDSLDPRFWNALNPLTISNIVPELNDFGLVPSAQWEAKVLPSGGIILRNPFTKEGQWKWIKQALLDYPIRDDLPSNLDRQWGYPATRSSLDWWKSPLPKDDQERPMKKRKFAGNLSVVRSENPSACPIWKLRWITLGYHHDWDSKVYSEEKKTAFPDDLGQLCNIIASALGFENFSAQAAIVNYYHLDSTLSFHQDVSEPYQEAPLISISLGQSAIFLIGPDKEEWPTAVTLRSGDVFVMSGPCRLAYHGVPKVFSDDTLEFVAEDISDVEKGRLMRRYLEQSRININVRQVLKPGETNLPRPAGNALVQTHFIVF